MEVGLEPGVAACGRSTLTNVLDRLEQRRLVRRELNPSDRRSFTIHLTPRGTRQARHVADSLDVLEAAVRDAVSERDARGLDAVLDAISVSFHRFPAAGSLRSSATPARALGESARSSSARAMQIG